jgi:hypothetical protein
MNDDNELRSTKDRSHGVRAITLGAILLAATALGALVSMVPADASPSSNVNNQTSSESRTGSTGSSAISSERSVGSSGKASSSEPSDAPNAFNDAGLKSGANNLSRMEGSGSAHLVLTADNIPVGPYSMGKDGDKSPLAKAITVMTNNGAGGSQEAGVTGDWTKEGADGLKIWQGSDPLKAVLKVCVNDGLNGGSLKTRCVNSVSDADYGVSTEIERDTVSGQVRLKGSALQSASIPAIAADDQEPKYIYVRLPSDFSDPNAREFSGGQIVALPVVRDRVSPVVPALKVFENREDESGKCKGENCRGADESVSFTSLQHSVLKADDNTLHSDGSGIVVALSVRDEERSMGGQTASAGLSGPSDSGVDHIVVHYKGKVLTDEQLAASACNVTKTSSSVAENTLQFCINWDLLQKVEPSSVLKGRVAPVSISDFSVVAYDVAGNDSKLLNVADSAPFKVKGKPVVSYIRLYKFPTAKDMEASGFSAVVYRKPNASDKSPASIVQDNPTILQGQTAYAKPLMNKKMLQWFDDLSVFKPVLEQRVLNLGANSGPASGSQCIYETCGVRDSVERGSATLPEGSYSVQFIISYKGDESAGVVVPPEAVNLNTPLGYVLVDATAPTIGVTAKGEETSAGNSYPLPDLPTVSVRVAGSQNKDDQGVRFAIRLQDLLKGSDSNNVRGMNEAGASGLSFDSAITKAQFSYVRYSEYTDAVAVASGRSPKRSGVPATVTWGAVDLDESGNVMKDVVLPADGAYLIRDMKVTVSDKAGNTAIRKFGRQDGRFNPGYDILVMEGAIKDKSVGIELKDADGTPAGQTPYYHRGSVSAVVSINDKWFTVARELQRNQSGSAKLIFGSVPKGSIDVADRAFPFSNEKREPTLGPIP